MLKLGCPHGIFSGRGRVSCHWTQVFAFLHVLTIMVRFPHIEEFVVSSGVQRDLPFFTFAAQGGANVFFAVLQCLERDLQGRAVSEAFHVLEDRAHDFAMLAIAALRNIALLHGFKNALANLG